MNFSVRIIRFDELPLISRDFRKRATTGHPSKRINLATKCQIIPFAAPGDLKFWASDERFDFGRSPWLFEDPVAPYTAGSATGWHQQTIAGSRQPHLFLATTCMHGYATSITVASQHPIEPLRAKSL